jgi:hypothetical protein
MTLAVEEGPNFSLRLPTRKNLNHPKFHRNAVSVSLSKL